jgi:hypothetical protein
VNGNYVNKVRILSLLLWVLLVGACTAVVFLPLQASRWAVSCRITLPPDEELSVVIDDPAEIEKLVLEPTRLGQRDPFGKSGGGPGLVVFGDLVISYATGREERYWLFVPLGFYRKEGVYYKADFSKLKQAIRSRIEGRSGMELARQCLDQE